MSTSPYYCSFVGEEFIICECGDNFPNEEELRIHIANEHKTSIKTEDFSNETEYECESENEQTFTDEQDEKKEYILSDYCIQKPVKVKTELIDENEKLVTCRATVEQKLTKILPKPVTNSAPVELKLTKILPKPTMIINKFAGNNSGDALKNLTKLKMSPVKLIIISPNKSIIDNYNKISTPNPVKKVSPPMILNQQSSSQPKVINFKKADVVSKEWLASQIMKAQTAKETIPTIQLTKSQLQNLQIPNRPVIKLDATMFSKAPLKQQKTYITKKGNPIKINTKQDINTNKKCKYTILKKNVETIIYDETDDNGEHYEMLEAKHENEDEDNEIFEENYEVEEANEIIEETNEIVEQSNTVEVPIETKEEVLTEEQKEYIIYDENGTELRREFLTDEEAANYNITYEDIAMETITETTQVDEAYVNETEIATETILPDRSPEESCEWQCELCGEKFAKRRQYSTHFRRVHEEGLILEKMLRRNKKTNMKQTIYAVICETCGKRCGSKVLLKYHQTVHTGEKPYPCTECNKAFSTPMLLQIHMRVHTGETPYHCSQCPKAFKNKAALNRHDRVHTGVKPYACPECGKCFTQSNSMKLHVRTVHLKLPAPYKRKPRNKPVQIMAVEEIY